MRFLEARCGLYVLVSELCGPVPTQVVFFGDSTFEGNTSVFIPIQRTQHRVANFREKKVILFAYLESALDKYMIDVP